MFQIDENYKLNINYKLWTQGLKKPRAHIMKNTPRQIIIRLLRTKGKEKTLKTAREKRHITRTGRNVKMTMDFLSGSMWETVRQQLWCTERRVSCQFRNLYAVRVPFRNRSEIKPFWTHKSWKNSSAADAHY